MSTLTTKSGKSLTIKIDSTSTVKSIKNLRSRSLSVSADVDETTTADSGSFKEFIAQFLDASIDFAGKATEASDTGLVTAEILALMVAKTLIYWEWGTGVSGSPKISGQGIITSFDENSEYDSEVEFSGSIQNSGDPTFTTYA